MFVEQKIYLNGSLWNQKLPTHFEQFSEKFGLENPDVLFFECAPRIRELIFLKISELKKTANWP